MSREQDERIGCGFEPPVHWELQCLERLAVMAFYECDRQGRQIPKFRYLMNGSELFQIDLDRIRPRLIQAKHSVLVSGEEYIF